MHCSVIATVFNERDAIGRLLESLASQTRPPDEIIICDGGSSDGTLELLQAHSHAARPADPPLHVISAPGANISRGRNLAIRAAQYAIIAVTDAGVRLEPEWLEHLVAPWMRGGVAPIGAAGVFIPDVSGVFQTAMAATVLPLVDDIDPATFLPSSRSVAFTRAAWEAAGGYPEWLDYCEDLILDLRLNQLGRQGTSVFSWAPGARVHFRPRTTLRSFWTQYYRYARGDGKADLWRLRHAIRYGTYLIALPLLAGHALFGFAAKWLGWFGLLAGIAIYCRRPAQRVWRIGSGLRAGERFAALAWVPVIRVVGDVAKMCGYPVGLWWRWQNRSRPEIWWRGQHPVAAEDAAQPAAAGDAPHPAAAGDAPHPAADGPERVGTRDH